MTQTTLSAAVPPQSAAETVWIDLNLVDLPPDARTHNPDKLESLTADLKTDGQLQEIVVCRNGERFEVVAGVGRVLAARQLGWEKIRAQVREGLSEYDKARITYAENEEREDADPFYQANQLQKMMKGKGWSQNQLAENLGQARRNIQIYLGLLTLDPQVCEVARRLATPISQLTELMRLSDSHEQARLAQECHDKDLSVRQLKALVDKKLNQNEPTSQKSKEPRLDVAWKGEKIAINRLFNPKEETKHAYLAWLSQALNEALAEKSLASTFQPAAEVTSQTAS